MDLSKYKKVEHEDGRIEFIPLNTFVKLNDVDQEKYPRESIGEPIEIICRSSLTGILNIDQRGGKDLILVAGHNYEIVPIEPFVSQSNQRFKVKIKK